MRMTRSGTTGGPARRRAKGTALIEFALTAPLLLLLLAGTLNYAVALRAAASVAEAARAGAQYGSRSADAALDIAGMQQAARNAAPDVEGLAVTAERSCRCPGGAAVDCGGSCAGGKMMAYAQVTARATTPSLFRYAGLGFSGDVSARAVWRAQ